MSSTAHIERRKLRNAHGTGGRDQLTPSIRLPRPALSDRSSGAFEDMGERQTWLMDCDQSGTDMR